MPIPITTAPSIWFRPANGLRMRPASMTVTTRLTRNRAISGCHVTSDVPVADVLRAARDAGGAVVAELHARLRGESSGDPRTPGHSPAERQTVALHRADRRGAPGP